MYLLNLPKYTIKDYFEDFLDGRHDNSKNNYIKTRLLAAKSIFIDAEKNYQELATGKLLHTIDDHDIIAIPNNVKLDNKIPRIINASDMEKAYTNFLVDKPMSQKIGRKVYESILSNTTHNLCPYCSHRDVKTVDHYLPKAKYISYAITPLNLLPCCSDCNKDKLDSHSLIEENMLIHPYFDDISQIDWLECRVIENSWPISFAYEVSDDITDLILKSRIMYQFKLLNLGKLYADNATREFNKRVKSLLKEYNSNPSNKALDFINDNLESYLYDNPNSWQTKLFKALKKSKWFAEDALPKLQKFYEK
ncbi:hypothetical protein JG789_06730 [Bacillus halotolerans]|uniref:hypothetical protein n=1 Tax=Bacillus halotolerans TaxID=260554 RepID=UPI0018F182D8|nr:hypothetical protein [Bacillus halotolerans]MBJ7570898.1 hypothetical protein [Bacillus halotolerans]